MHMNYFDQELRQLLASFPVYFTVFPDYLDLRRFIIFGLEVYS